MGLLATLLPTLLPLVVQLVDGLFGRGQGATKATAANTIAQAVIDGLQKSGITQGTMDAEHLKALVEYVFQELNAKGQVNQTNDTVPVVVPSASGAVGGNFVLTFKDGLLVSFG